MACVANEPAGWKTSYEPTQLADNECSTPQLEVCTIRFLLLDGNDFRVAFPPNTTVLQLKERVLEDRPQAFLSFLEHNRLPSPLYPSDIRLFYFGKDMEEEKTLQDYGISPQEVSTIHFVVRMRTHQVVQSEKDEVKKQRACASCVIC
ncbi:hypothetical protein Gasu2_43800 [Galdieria sulphuraria]|uniref:Ubiquitin-like domain-containing protein n=1 Tax=Galdieria sulphuraria TaxID=130081 RepID=M2XVT2_GALSU|nr:uncharacterized protein Gasu_47440 [Galdieria sulphuraria]EME27758.1 hypothetical protein Gasu_47440 [Galdieria sulphuraria]GJD10172.1 hypothetical protein Gasu2_43800 [Galdieria sulphuraria]|eukprot:XP_005704278.1 hypothetical protein Gasu_47440 [Galdieria sulphuraria]